MDSFVLDDVLAQVRNALVRDDLVGAAAVIESLQPADQADLVEELSDVDQVALLS
jgi:Mg/Co/Ni transporter MgtE